MSKPLRMKYATVAHRLRAHSATFIRESGNHKVWRCGCGAHQTAVPRYDVSSYVVDKIGRQMPCLGKEWWQ